MSRTIRQANRVTEDSLAEFIPTSQIVRGKRYQVQLCFPGTLDPDTRDKIWDIFEANMHGFYTESSFGWDPPSKKAELFDGLSRFIVVRDPELAPSSLPQPATIIAYTMFRFDREADEDVLYCYELQVVASAQKSGLGRVLIECLEVIGARLGLGKIMLTQLKDNEPAFHFYNRIRFTEDPSSPGFIPGDDVDDGEVWEDEDCDYRILSRAIRKDVQPPVDCVA